MPPEKVEASIFAQLIIQNWIDQVRAMKQEASDRGLSAERHTLDHAQWMLQACDQLFDAAMKGDYEYLSNASTGIDGAPVFTDPETGDDVLVRVCRDLSFFYDGDAEKVNTAMNIIENIDVVLDSFKKPAPPAPAPPMNRAARRRAARGR
jgi:hypothetical protein